MVDQDTHISKEDLIQLVGGGKDPAYITPKLDQLLSQVGMSGKTAFTEAEVLTLSNRASKNSVDQLAELDDPRAKQIAAGMAKMLSAAKKMQG